MVTGKSKALVRAIRGYVRSKWGREPAAIIGGIASVVLLAIGAQTGETTWETAAQDAIPFIVSLFIRREVSPATEESK